MSEEKPEGLGGVDGLANLAKHFIIRDLIYTIGGGVLIASVAYAWGAASAGFEALKTAPPLLSLLLLGLSWAVGYAISDGLGGIVPAFLTGAFTSGAKLSTRSPRFWPFVRTDYIHTPQGFSKRLFESFAQEEWGFPAGQHVSVDDWRDMASELINQGFGAYHRTVLLRHLGAAIGACGLLSSIIAGFAAYQREGVLGLLFSVLGFLVSVLLLMIGWVKALQQTHEVNRAVLKRKRESISAVRREPHGA